MNKSVFKFSFLLSLLAVFIFGCVKKNNFETSKLSKKTTAIVLRIEKINILMGSAVYSSGKKPKQYENFENLKKNASIEELKALTNHANGVVRCYSFWALSNYKEADLFSIVKKHITDDTPIETLFGCIKSQEKVGDFFINLITPEYVDTDIKKLNKKEFVILDSLLIYRENNLDSRFRAIQNASPTEFLYPKIRELVIKQNNQTALVTLAKYKKESDINLILKNNDSNSGYFYTYKAIQNFPDSDFLPLLEKNLNLTLNDDHYDGEWLQLYTAIATYKNQKSLELLKIPFTKVKHQNIKKYHIHFVYEAILANKSKIYDDLLWKIWEEENLITMEGFKYLLGLNKSKTYEFTNKKLVENYQTINSETILKTNNDMISESLDETMLNFILLNDKTTAYSIITNKIINTDVNDFEMYCSKILEFKDKIFIEPLFKRMLKDDNPHVYLQISETLIAFKDISINKRILETRKKNKSMNEGWGSESLDKILKENNIK
ncbi:hypothetical protein [Flavobacterium pectinovorum]|uniref:hypothetical protein n=1 Tax=Flavobacterium pectinovorum TaxID=29533 RepID=UPI001FAC6636|nr:hypothetical protein [Flavobacterium pectinovorum]MCI9844778.1 hypothetical protein [Flavobacterium pectinovorum]